MILCYKTGVGIGVLCLGLLGLELGVSFGCFVEVFIRIVEDMGLCLGGFLPNFDFSRAGGARHPIKSTICNPPDQGPFLVRFMQAVVSDAHIHIYIYICTRLRRYRCNYMPFHAL